MQQTNVCGNCGSPIELTEFFCRSCGRSLTSKTASTGARNSSSSPTTMVDPAPVKQPRTTAPSLSPAPPWSGGTVPQFSRPQLHGPDPQKEAISGAGFGALSVVLMLLGIYVIFILKWLVGAAGAPGLGGFLTFVLLHGGSLSVDVPTTDALLGIGGTLMVDPPTTPLALLPFLVFLTGGWLASRRLSASWIFVLSASLVYGVLVILTGILGTTQIELTQEAQITISSASLSSGLWAFLLAALGGTLGISGGGGPILPEWIRQIIKGGFAAVGVSFATALLLAFIIFIAGLAPDVPEWFADEGSEPSLNEPAPAQPGTEPATPQDSAAEGDAAGDFSGVLSGLFAAVGTFFALLPSMLGSFWLLANGMPVGLQNASDLSSIPLIGEVLGNVPLSMSLLGDWPMSNAWRLLLVSPVAGLVVGGMIAGRNAQNAPLSGALVAVPYAITAAIVIALCKLSLSLSVSAASVDLAFGTPILWTLAFLPVAALFGALGGRLRSQSFRPLVSYPKRAALATASVSGLLFLFTLPVLFGSAPSEEDMTHLMGPSNMPMPELEAPAPPPAPPPAPEFDFEDPPSV
jgi:hypothetical protein